LLNNSVGVRLCSDNTVRRIPMTATRAISALRLLDRVSQSRCFRN
jgi:hypothetical protein